MNKLIKSDYMLKGMVSEFKKKPDPKLLSQIIGLKFKHIRLDKNITAEAVVDDNKKYFKSIYSLYKFEKGINTTVAKFYALSKYYKYDVVQLFERLN